ncbi:MAG TPA: hypothetical protein V6C81_25440 [Planktothrix sp.]|jgi:hypothetical protein
MRTSINTALILFSAGAMVVLNAGLAWSESSLNRDKIIEAIRKEKILKADAPLTADFQGNEVELVTMRSPLAKDNDCKIDSMLMAKALMQVFPGQVMRLKVQFGHANGDDSDEVTVTAGEVKAYGAGALSESELMASIDMQTQHATEVEAERSSSSIKPGPAKETRMLIAGYIEELRAHGTDVKPFEARLKQIEDTIGSADSITIKEQSLDLKRRLLDEEAMINEAKGIQTEQPRRPEQPRRAASEAAAGAKVSSLLDNASPGRPAANNKFKWMHLAGIEAQVRQRKDSGKNTRQYDVELNDIQSLLQEKKFEEAQTELNQLSKELRLNP